MKKIIVFYALLYPCFVFSQNIDFETFAKACDSISYYDIVINNDLEIKEFEKRIYEKTQEKYLKSYNEYLLYHKKDSLLLFNELAFSYILNAQYFKRKNKYYLAIKSCDKSIEIQFKYNQIDYIDFQKSYKLISEISCHKYPKPLSYINNFNFYRAMIYYDILSGTGYTTESNYILINLLIKNLSLINSASFDNLINLFERLSSSELIHNIYPNILRVWFDQFYTQINKRYKEKSITEIQYYNSISILLAVNNIELFKIEKLDLNLKYDFDSIFGQACNGLLTRNFTKNEINPFLYNYFLYKFNNLSKFGSIDSTFNDRTENLITSNIYNNNEDILAIWYSISINPNKISTYNYDTDRDKARSVLFHNRGIYSSSNLTRLESIYKSNQNFLGIQIYKNPSFKLNYNTFLFDYLNALDFDSTDLYVVNSMKKIPDTIGMCYYPLIEYQIRHDNDNYKLISAEYRDINFISDALNEDEAFIYTDYITINHSIRISESQNKHTPKLCKYILIITKYNTPKIYLTFDFLEKVTYDSYEISNSYTPKVSIDIKKNLAGIEKIYTYDDPWPWVLLDTDGNYMCHNYEFHKITSLNEIINKSKNVKSDFTSKNAVVYSNPNFNNPIENTYATNDRKQPDTAIIRGVSEDLAYYFSNNNKGGTNKTILKPLPNTKIEAKDIIAILNRNNIKTDWYNNEDAKEEYLYNRTSPYILHFATHGISLNKDSLDKAFLFYNALTFCNATNAINNGYSGFIANKQDGLLTGLEILNLNLSSTELVVLSACETGKGTAENWINGTYYNSLQRAFRLAGAKAVLASKWKVPDKQTQELMVEFYTNWLEKKMTKHKALQQAQLTMSKKYPEPYYWAAWVLYGE